MAFSEDVVHNGDVLTEFTVDTHSHRILESAVEDGGHGNSGIEVSVLEVDSCIE